MPKYFYTLLAAFVFMAFSSACMGQSVTVKEYRYKIYPSGKIMGYFHLSATAQEDDLKALEAKMVALEQVNRFNVFPKHPEKEGYTCFVEATSTFVTEEWLATSITTQLDISENSMRNASGK